MLVTSVVCKAFLRGAGGASGGSCSLLPDWLPQHYRCFCGNTRWLQLPVIYWRILTGISTSPWRDPLLDILDIAVFAIQCGLLAHHNHVYWRLYAGGWLDGELERLLTRLFLQTAYTWRETLPWCGGEGPTFHPVSEEARCYGRQSPLI